MAGRSLILAVKIIGDATDAIKAMDEAAGKSKTFGDRLGTAAKARGAALVAIGVGAKVAVDAASELEQATGAVSSVFGEYAAEMMQYGKDAADAVGLSQSEYGNMASILGAQLKNMGISLEEAAGQSNDLIGLGADLAATFGGSTSDAVSALSSLLRGERDPIERYGVSIKQADIEAQKAKMGLDGLSGEAAKNADLQATLALLTSQTADAQGQFAREADSAAGSAQTAAAHFENAKAALGEALLPIVTAMSQKLSELAGWFQKNASWITPLIGVVAALAAAVVIINAAYSAFTAVQAMQTAAQWASNAAWLASPVTWIILAIIAAIALLIAIIVLVVKHWDKIKAVAVIVFTVVIEWVKKAIAWIGEKIVGAITAVRDWFDKLKVGAKIVWEAIISWVKKAVTWLGDKITQPIRDARAAFTKLRDGAVAVFEKIIEWVKKVLDWIGDLVASVIPDWAKDLLGMSDKKVEVTSKMLIGADRDYAAMLAAAPGAIAAPSTAQQTTAEDHRSYTFNFPNYVGDRADLEAMLLEALRKAKIRDERIVHA